MAKGKKYSGELKEKVYARYSAGDGLGEIAKDLKLPYSTIRGWVQKMPADNLCNLREQHRKEFIESANRIISKGMKLLERRFDNALSKEEELLGVIDEIAKSGEDVISDKAKAEVIGKLKALLVYDPKAIAVAVGTVYDKREKSEERQENKTEGGVVFLPEKKKMEE